MKFTQLFIPSDLGTELLDGLILFGPVLGTRGVPDPPAGYLSLQPLVFFLQPVHLLQEALQASIQAPHCVTGVLQRVHGHLRESECLQSHAVAEPVKFSYSQMTQLVVPVMAKPFRQYVTDRRVFTRAYNFLCSVKPTRCQRRLQGKCLPSDTHLQQRGLP